MHSYIPTNRAGEVAVKLKPEVVVRGYGECMLAEGVLLGCSVPIRVRVHIRVPQRPSLHCCIAPHRRRVSLSFHEHGAHTHARAWLLRTALDMGGKQGTRSVVLSPATSHQLNGQPQHSNGVNQTTITAVCTT